MHPTDFSALSKKAFVHALRLALNAQCKLSVIHVAELKTVDEEIAYSFLSRILSQWRLAEQRDSRSISTTALPPQIEHIALRGGDLADTLTEYVSRQEPELIILGTHGRTDLDHLMKGSIAETLFSRTSASTLFISPHTRGFVDPVTGECSSTVFWTPHRKPESVAVAVGSFADPAFPAPTQAVYAERSHPCAKEDLR